MGSMLREGDEDGEVDRLSWGVHLGPEHAGIELPALEGSGRQGPAPRWRRGGT